MRIRVIITLLAHGTPCPLRSGALRTKPTFTRRPPRRHSCLPQRSRRGAQRAPAGTYELLVHVAEPLRLGTVALLKHLRRLGWDVWVYTTSMRGPWSVRLQFWAYGVRLGGVINSDGHVRRLATGWPDHRSVSKYPPAFGIDLLVDDLEGVRLEGKRFGFSVLRVDPGDEGWVDAIRAAVERGQGR